MLITHAQGGNTTIDRHARRLSDHDSLDGIRVLIWRPLPKSCHLQQASNSAIWNGRVERGIVCDARWDMPLAVMRKNFLAARLMGYLAQNRSFAWVLLKTPLQTGSRKIYPPKSWRPLQIGRARKAVYASASISNGGTVIRQRWRGTGSGLIKST